VIAICKPQRQPSQTRARFWPAAGRYIALACLCFILAIFGLSIGPCFADIQSDRQTCRSQDLDLNIPACTRILGDPASSEADKKEAYASRGFAYLSQNSFISAGRDFDDLLRIEPGNVKALIGRAISAVRRGDIDHAVLDFSLATRLDANAVNAMTATQTALAEIAAAAERNPPPRVQLDELQSRLIRCRAGTRQDGLSCVPIVCPEGQRLDGNSCLAIACNQGYELQHSTCVALPPPPRIAPPGLLIVASASRWCTSRRTYSLRVETDRIVWTDSQGSVDVERIVSNEETFAQTVTQESRHSSGDAVPRGTVWTYVANGANRIRVSKDGGNSFLLNRC
jgi:hypothetical protein